VDALFGISDPINCPIVLCSIHDAGKCGQPFSGSAYLSLSLITPWTITVFKSEISQTHDLCLVCSASNHSEQIDNFKVNVIILPEYPPTFLLDPKDFEI
jgi:hypothetical protein